MSNKKLLVADDSLTIQKVIKLALSNDGYEIQAVSEGNDAIQHISVFRPSVVLIDVSLPGQSAFEVKSMTNQQPDLSNVKFVLMSSAFETIDEGQYEQAKFDGRLTKPFDPAQLREILTKVIAESEDGESIAPPPFNPSDDKAAHIHFDPPDLDSKANLEMPQGIFPENYPENYKEELPIVKNDSHEQITELWEPGQEPTIVTEPFLATPATPPLTEQRMSPEENLASNRDSSLHEIDSQWNVSEPTLKTDPFTPPPFSPPPLNSSIESKIGNQLETTIQQLVEKMLPEIAEKIIKQEIHKLLSQ